MRSLIAAVVCGLTVFVSLIAQDGPETVVRGTKQFRQSEVVTGLAGPYEVTWGPDNMLWVTERTGKRITRVNPSTGEKKVAVTIDEVLAPGGQDGLLGLALDLDNNFVYTGYTYTDKSLPPHETRAATSPYRFLYTKIVRFTYDRAKETLSDPVTLDLGHARGQRPPSRADEDRSGPQAVLHDRRPGERSARQLLRPDRITAAADAGRDPGEELRLVRGEVAAAESRWLDSQRQSADRRCAEPRLHLRPSQSAGIDFGPDGTLYESEHGPKTDDEINVLKAGANYGWPHVAGLKDNKAYEYARWAESTTPCSQLKFSDLAIAPTVPREPESAFTKPFTEPIATMFTVPTGYNFSDPVCKGIDYICWPTVGVSSIEYYGASRKRHPRLGESAAGDDTEARVVVCGRAQRRWAERARAVLALLPIRQPLSRYRRQPRRQDHLHRDRSRGLTEAIAGGTTRTMVNQGSILAFTYVGEGTGAAVEPQRTTTTHRENRAGCSGLPAGGSGRRSAIHGRAGRRGQNGIRCRLRGVPREYVEERHDGAAARRRGIPRRVGRAIGS